MSVSQDYKSKYHNRLVAGHNFLVFFGHITVSFAKISGFTNELNVEAISEGGVNDAMIMLAGPRKKLSTIVYEHGVGKMNLLNKQFTSTQEMGLVFTFPTTILIFDNGGTLKRAVGYNGGVATKWALSDLNAQSGEILMDRIEVMHQGLFDVDVK